MYFIHTWINMYIYIYVCVLMFNLRRIWREVIHLTV